MKPVKISVLMTIFNHENYVKDSIKSLFNQNYKNWELIAIDNGSTDNSTGILKKISDKRIIKKYLKKNIGRTKCLNLGLRYCKGDFVAILDSDDVLKKNRLAEQLNEFMKNKKLGMVASDFNFINTKGKKIFYPKVEYNIGRDLKKKPRKFLYENFFAHSTVMFERKLVKKIGGYPSNFLYAQDYALYLKILKKYDVKILKKKLVDIRAPHINSEGTRVLKTRIADVEIFKILAWNLKNFETSLNEKIIIIYHMFKKFLKIYFPNLTQVSKR